MSLMNVVSHLPSPNYEAALSRINTNLILVFDAAWILIYLMIVCISLILLGLALLGYRTFFSQGKQLTMPTMRKVTDTPKKTQTPREPWTWEGK